MTKDWKKLFAELLYEEDDDGGEVVEEGKLENVYETPKPSKKAAAVTSEEKTVDQETEVPKKKSSYLIDVEEPKGGSQMVHVGKYFKKKKDEEYESYLRRVKENPLARQVKLADLAHNTSPERASGLNEKRRAKYELAKRILTEANAIKCPKCGKELAPIIYGLPTSEAVEASSRGEIFLGGCEVYPNSPKYHCYNCILDFDKDLKKPTKSDNTPIDFLDFGEE